METVIRPGVSAGRTTDLERTLELAFERPDWWDQAACRGVGTEVFFRPEGVPQSGPGYERWVAQAEVLCARCPVWSSCRAAHANEVYGVWFGTRSNRARNEQVAS